MPVAPVGEEPRLGDDSRTPTRELADQLPTDQRGVLDAVAGCPPASSSAASRRISASGETRCVATPCTADPVRSWASPAGCGLVEPVV
jgi:hypothetical protein